MFFFIHSRQYDEFEDQKGHNETMIHWKHQRQY